MSKFVPFKNESDVLNIGHLTIENRLDRISIGGDVDLTADQAGLADARALRDLLSEVVARLEAQDLPAQLPPPAVNTVINPFD
jgi:hypothetical protein